VAATLIALALVGLIALWTLDPFSGDGTAASGSSGGASSSAPATSPSASEPAPSSSAETSASESAGPPVDAGTVKGSDVDRAVKDFFKGIPNDQQAAYALTSPGFQSQHPYESFSGFWQGFKDAKVDNIRTEDGSTSATVDITYVTSDNSRQTEQHLLSFVPGNDGSLLLDDDTYQSQVG
jgi:hypothetical protein